MDDQELADAVAADAFDDFMRDVLTPREIESLDDMDRANDEMNAATKAWMLARSPALSAESEAALTKDERRFYRLAKGRLS